MGTEDDLALIALSDVFLPVPDAPEVVQPLLAVVPLQLGLGLALAVADGESMPALRLCCRIVFVALLLSAPVGAAQAKARTFYVATNGDDRWSGTLPAANDQRTDGPLRSLSEAIKKSRRGRHHEAGRAQILLHTGTFTLAEPLVLTTEDSGLTVAACRHESPVISGQTLLRGWKCFTRNPNVWQTEIADVRNGNWIFHELFVNGQRKESGFRKRDSFGRLVRASLAVRTNCNSTLATSRRNGLCREMLK